jgi:hypothetical protein
VLAGTVAADPVQRRMPSAAEVTGIRLSVSGGGIQLGSGPALAPRSTTKRPETTGTEGYANAQVKTRIPASLQVTESARIGLLIRRLSVRVPPRSCTYLQRWLGSLSLTIDLPDFLPRSGRRSEGFDGADCYAVAGWLRARSGPFVQQLVESPREPGEVAKPARAPAAAQARTTINEALPVALRFGSRPGR